MQQQETRGGTSLQRQEQSRVQIREWLEAISRRFAVKPRAIAVKAGVSPATIYRALDPDGDFVMSFSVINKIGQEFGMPAPGHGAQAAGGFGEELTPFDGDAPDWSPKSATNHGRWQLNSEVLNLEGYRPGDILEFDMGVAPERGDIVVAQVYDHKSGSAETVLRLYNPPYLLTRSSDAAVDTRPLYVDGERVVIMGTLVRMLRLRAA